MLFLLEVKKFDQFNKVMAHAKRVMDKVELDTITKQSSQDSRGW